MNGEALHSPGFGSFHCYLFGNEARGLPRDQLSALGARAFTIPGTGAIESLNLASAVNISLYELNRQPEGA
jgi:TrmH family RNA methyltransferase